MTEKEAIYILRNAAWLGSDADRQKVEEAVEVVAKAIEAQDMTLYMNLPEVSAEEVVEILKRNNRIELLPPAQPEQAVKDCRNCKHGKYNDYHDTYFCYNAEDCSNWDKWETSAQPVHIPLDTDDIFDAELAKRILNNK